MVFFPLDKHCCVRYFQAMYEIMKGESVATRPCAVRENKVQEPYHVSACRRWGPVGR